MQLWLQQAVLCEELAGRDAEINQLRSAAESTVKRRLQEVMFDQWISQNLFIDI